MWQLIVKKGVPPTRIIRYCCQELKELGGEGRFIVTGVRKSESTKRAERELLEIKGKTKEKKIVFTHDNDEAKIVMYHCMNKRSPILNPIIDWTDDEVWEFLGYYGCKSNPLYGCGYKRIGCVGCPMAQGKHGQLKEFEDYPKYRELYIRTFDRMLKKRIESGKDNDRANWTDGEAVFRWWTSGKGRITELDGQMDL
jgi:phosphoadenosine phosphosulfate reductase